MIKDIFYIIVVSWCFIVMITIKICNTIVNVNQIKATKDMMSLDKNKLNFLLGKMEER